MSVSSSITFVHHSNTFGYCFRNTPLRHQASQPGRTSSIISNVSGGSVPEEFSDDEYDDDDEYDNIDGMNIQNKYVISLSDHSPVIFRKNF